MATEIKFEVSHIALFVYDSFFLFDLIMSIYSRASRLKINIVRSGNPRIFSLLQDKARVITGRLRVSPTKKNPVGS